MWKEYGACLCCHLGVQNEERKKKKEGLLVVKEKKNMVLRMVLAFVYYLGKSLECVLVCKKKKSI